MFGKPIGTLLKLDRPSDRMPRNTRTQRIAAAKADLIEGWVLDEMELWGKPETPLAEYERIDLPPAERRKVSIMFRQDMLRHRPSGRIWHEVRSNYTSPAAEEKWTPDYQRPFSSS